MSNYNIHSEDNCSEKTKRKEKDQQGSEKKKSLFTNANKPASRQTTHQQETDEDDF